MVLCVELHVALNPGTLFNHLIMNSYAVFFCFFECFQTFLFSTFCALVFLLKFVVVQGGFFILFDFKKSNILHVFLRMPFITYLQSSFRYNQHQLLFLTKILIGL